MLPNLNCGLDLIGEVLYGKWKIRLLPVIAALGQWGDEHEGRLRELILKQVAVRQL